MNDKTISFMTWNLFSLIYFIFLLFCFTLLYLFHHTFFGKFICPEWSLLFWHDTKLNFLTLKIFHWWMMKEKFVVKKFIMISFLIWQFFLDRVRGANKYYYSEIFLWYFNLTLNESFLLNYIKLKSCIFYTLSF